MALSPCEFVFGRDSKQWDCWVKEHGIFMALDMVGLVNSQPPGLPCCPQG